MNVACGYAGGHAYGAHSGDFTVLNNNDDIGFITAADSSDFTFDGIWAKVWATPPKSGGAPSLFGFIAGLNNGAPVWQLPMALNGSFQFIGPQAGMIDELQLGFGDIFLVDDLVLNARRGLQPSPSPALSHCSALHSAHSA